MIANTAVCLGRVARAAQKQNPPIDPNVWMWRYVKHGDHVYSFGYSIAQSKRGHRNEAFLRLYRSRDGRDWSAVTQTRSDGAC